MSQMKRPPVLVATAAAAVVLVVLAVLFLTSRGDDQAAIPASFPEQTTFEAQAWSGSAGFPAVETARAEMVEDLMNGDRLAGQSMAAVSDLLGDPQREYDVDGATRWAYWLGRYGFDGSYLEVGFEDGTVATTGLTEFG